jgi:hypothetical protein
MYNAMLFPEGVYLVYSSFDPRSKIVLDAFVKSHGDANVIDLWENPEMINFYSSRVTRSPSLVFVNKKRDFLYSTIMDIPQAINNYLGL